MMAVYTLVIPNFDRTPEGYRTEIARLRRLVMENPDNQGYRDALEATEGGLDAIENISEEDARHFLGNLRKALAESA
jgi:hypothetical protein